MNFNIAQSAAIHTTAQDWSQRVVKNGGASPSGDTVRTLSTFMRGMDNAGLTSKMKSVNCYVPDNLSASVTPLIKTFGNDPWTNTAFVASDLTIAGLKGNATTKFLDTGVKPSLTMATGSGGISVYITSGSNATEIDAGVWNVTGATNQMGAYIGYGGSAYWDCWNSNGGRVSGANSGFTGFITFNRVSTSASNVYKASSTVAYSVVASGSGQSDIGAPTSSSMYMHRANLNTSGNPSFSTKRFSFAAIHDGLSVADGTALYNLVQTMRQQLGGGYV